MSTATAEPERLEFKTELKQLLDLIVHSLYTKSEIFLRELVSNAADAIDKVRFEGLTKPEMLEGNTDYKIRITPDPAAGTLTVSDNGIGMDRAAVVENLGTIARSGTRQFLDNLRKADAKDRPELIGQFGVGFYSAYMVADRVTVVSRAAGSAEAVKWESDGQGQFTVEPAERATRGTDVIVHLKDEHKDFLQPWRIREVVRRYSNFIEHPIVTDVEKEVDGKQQNEEETLNSRRAIWLRSKAEVKPEEYAAFYREISRDFEDPLKTIHFSAEGAQEFKALLFIPKRKPFDFYHREPKSGVALYIRRVLIQHESEDLLPTYLRFVKGVVDSADLPLNVSRETLQHNPKLAKIRSNLVNRVLKGLEEMKSASPDEYRAFYAEFGNVLKEGVQDFENRTRIADLLLIESSKADAGKHTTLEQYVTSAKTDQTEIYYLTGDSREQLANSPLLEKYRADGVEVLLLFDPVDEFFVQTLGSYKDKPFKPVDRGAQQDDALKEQAEAFKPLLAAVKEKLPDVKDVRLTSRLKDSAAVLVVDDHAMGAAMERLMRRAGRLDEAGASPRILELNPDHPVVRTLKRLHEQDPADARVTAIGQLLHDQATVAEGSKIIDPVAFARRMNEVIVKAME